MSVALPSEILIACHAWHQDLFGGAFKLAAELGEHLARNGHTVNFLCGAEPTGFDNPTEMNGMKLWRYPFPEAPSPSPKNLWGHLRRSWRLAREIAAQARITSLNGHSPLQFLAASRALRQQECRTVYSTHSPFAKELEAAWRAPPAGENGEAPPAFSVKQRAALKLVGALERRVYSAAQTVQTFSHYTLSVISDIYPQAVGDHGEVCPGWVDLERFRPCPDRDAWRDELGEPWRRGETTFLCVRRLERRMGLDNLIAACAELAGEGRKFRLLLGGSGPLRAELERQAEAEGLGDTVHFLGRIAEADLPRCYAAADCFVLPTRSLECFGLIVLEAYASGVPVISTPVGALPEVMGKPGRQWLCADTSAGAIAERLRAFLDGQLECDANALRRHAESYSDALVLPRLARLVLGKDVVQR